MKLFILLWFLLLAVKSNALLSIPTDPNAYNLPCRVGSPCLELGNNFFTNGCGNLTDSCTSSGYGDYQSCKGCKYYQTCAPSGVFVRPCPANLNFDDNLKKCRRVSTTCQGP